MFRKIRNNLLVKGYTSLPLWGKIGVPVLGFILISMLVSTMKWVFWLGIIGLIAYLVLSAFLYIKDKRK